MVKLSPYRQGLRAEHRRWCRSASPIKSGFSLTRFQESELNPCLYELSQLGTVNSCHLPYANNLQKELPRIPHVATFEDFKAFEKAGRALGSLHVNYEQVEPYAGCTITGLEQGADASDLRVTKLKYGKIAGKKGNAALDKTKIVYNDQITISDIPLEVQDYVVNKKSALDWVVEGLADRQRLQQHGRGNGRSAVHPAPDLTCDHGEPWDQQDCGLTASSAHPPTGSVVSKVATFLSLLMRQSIVVLR